VTYAPDPLKSRKLGLGVPFDRTARTLQDAPAQSRRTLDRRNSQQAYLDQQPSIRLCVTDQGSLTNPSLARYPPRVCAPSSLQTFLGRNSGFFGKTWPTSRQLESRSSRRMSRKIRFSMIGNTFQGHRPEPAFRTAEGGSNTRIWRCSAG